MGLAAGLAVRDAVAPADTDGLCVGVRTMSIPELLEAPSIEGVCECGKIARGSSRTSTHAPTTGPNLSQKYDLGFGIVNDSSYSLFGAPTAAPIALATSLTAPTSIRIKPSSSVNGRVTASSITGPLTPRSHLPYWFSTEPH